MFGDIGKLLKLVSDLKVTLPALREKLAAERYSAPAADGAVTVIINGKMEIVEIKVDKPALAGVEADVLAGHIQSAFNEARVVAAKAAAEAMKELTGGMSIPGMEGMLG
jgi:DNA-binding YbaB/EbfC family protein